MNPSKNHSSPTRIRSGFHPQQLRGSDALIMLTIYVVLLVAIPSSVRIAALGAMGRPSLLWGLLLFVWWGLWRLMARPNDLAEVRSPVRVAFFALLVVALVSFAAALLRGQPADQVSPASTSIFRLLSWGGVILVAIDGIRTSEDLHKMVRRLALAGWLLACLGILQFLTRQSLIDWFSSLPGLELVEGGVTERGSFTRASGTSIHPLEHATALSAALPLTIAVALQSTKRWGPLAWGPPAIIALGSILAVSRSALIGLVVAATASLPALPKRIRSVAIVAGGAIAGVAIIVVPGLLTLFLELFAPSGDASTQSRTDALARLPQFVSESPVYGTGFGTFLPRYYIFDNAWAMMLVELGVLGLLAFLGIFLTSIFCSVSAARRAHDTETRAVGLTLAASVLTVGVVFAFFDGLSFPIAAGFAVVLFGLCGAHHTITKESSAAVAIGQAHPG